MESINRGEFRFFDRLRVRWAEVDMQKIVFNGHSLMYFDTAVAAYWRAMAMPYNDTMAYLDGELYVRLGTWDEIGREAPAIRTAVFVQEQQIPAEMEWDAADASCVHAVAYNRFGMALGTGRLLEHSPGVAKIGRMAVLQTMRGPKVGRTLLDALVQCARQRGEREVLLHAQMSAAGFYTRAGFAARGSPFDEAGIAHLEMVRAL